MDDGNKTMKNKEKRSEKVTLSLKQHIPFCLLEKEKGVQVIKSTLDTQ
ncbi:hypothetical protein [Paenibacillus polymyxa]|nr:hypothetical protein [Paenibacillus polymyxa]MCP3743363.1 hypothetical protein [Paenibacillus sp. A3M_27_13]